MAEVDNGGSAQNAGRPEPLGSEPAIVGIGASAGGIQALQTLFESLPETTGVAFVVIVHLAPEHHSELPRILAARTRMPVSQVNEAVPLEADHVYVTPPDRQLEIADNHIAAVEFEHPRARRAPIDLFFRSLAEQHGDGFAIILSGAGSDGSVGLKFVKEAGGIILVQDPDEAEYGSMPRSAIADGAGRLHRAAARYGSTPRRPGAQQGSYRGKTGSAQRPGFRPAHPLARALKNRP